jgi:Na+/H+-translocating membrane pyrophosphatase
MKSYSATTATEVTPLNTASHRSTRAAANPLHGFAAAYACAAIAASAVALALQTTGHFTGLFGAALVILAMPAIVGVIAVGCSSAVAAAGVVHHAFFTHSVSQKPLSHPITSAK